MSSYYSARRLKLYLQRTTKLLLVFGLLFAACYTGAAEAAGSSDLLVVNKQTNKLAYFSGGKLVRTFSVATGKTTTLTPEGIFPIVVKIKNRPYYKENIPGGDPANPLGDRWLGLEVNGTKGTTYAIHGNNNESSIGKYVSAGCIRMHNEDIHWLYPLIAKNTKVVITSSALDMEHIAIKNGYPLGSKTFAANLIINGVSTRLKDSFVLDHSRVFIPLRESVALLGGTLQQDERTGALIITLGKYKVTHQPLSSTAVVNGKSVTMLPSRTENNRLLIPLGSLPELFGIQVKWNPQAESVTILN
mgnify:CR=1 FL=1